MTTRHSASNTIPIEHYLPFCPISYQFKGSHLKPVWGWCKPTSCGQDDHPATWRTVRLSPHLKAAYGEIQARANHTGLCALVPTSFCTNFSRRLPIIFHKKHPEQRLVLKADVRAMLNRNTPDPFLSAMTHHLGVLTRTLTMILDAVLRFFSKRDKDSLIELPQWLEEANMHSSAKCANSHFLRYTAYNT